MRDTLTCSGALTFPPVPPALLNGAKRALDAAHGAWLGANVLIMHGSYVFTVGHPASWEGYA